MICARTSPISMKTSSRSVCNTSSLRRDFTLCSLHNFKLWSAKHNLRQSLYLISIFSIPLVWILASILSRFQQMCVMILILTHHMLKLIRGLSYLSVVTVNLTSPCTHSISFSYRMIWILMYQLLLIISEESLEASANHLLSTVLFMILKIWWGMETEQSTMDIYVGRFHLYIVWMRIYLIFLLHWHCTSKKKRTIQCGFVRQEMSCIYIDVYVYLV